MKKIKRVIAVFIGHFPKSRRALKRMAIACLVALWSGGILF